MLNLSIEPKKDIAIVSFSQTLWSQNLSPNYHLIVCLAILDKHRRIIIENEFGFTEILKVCRTLLNSFFIIASNRVCGMVGSDWEEMSEMGEDVDL